MKIERKNCPMRHPEIGNCLVAGGFCVDAISDEMCEALHNAYDSGYYDALRARQEDKKFNPPCYQPDQFGDGCAYQCYDGDDEPIDKCKECPLCNSDKHRTQQEAEENEPLTLEELRGMAEQPYYHVSLQIGGTNHWAILPEHIAKAIEDHHYGEYWLAYRRPPKENADAV